MFFSTAHICRQPRAWPDHPSLDQIGSLFSWVRICPDRMCCCLFTSLPTALLGFLTNQESTPTLHLFPFLLKLCVCTDKIRDTDLQDRKCLYQKVGVGFYILIRGYRGKELMVQRLTDSCTQSYYENGGSRRLWKWDGACFRCWESDQWSREPDRAQAGGGALPTVVFLQLLNLFDMKFKGSLYYWCQTIWGFLSCRIH